MPLNRIVVQSSKILLIILLMGLGHEATRMGANDWWVVCFDATAISLAAKWRVPNTFSSGNLLEAPDASR